MKVGACLRFAVCLSAVFGPYAVTAQKFQEPSKEELQMTSDPKAPGAPAVMLYREEITDNANHFVSEYARIKVLTELGKEWATVEVPHSGSGAPPTIEARTIQPDGTVVPLTGKAADLLVVKSHGDALNARVFTLPAVQVGSILEYRWTLPMGERTVGGVTSDMQGFLDSALASTIPYWDIQQSLFVHKEKFYYNPLGDLERNVLGNQSIIHYNSDGEIASYLLYSERLPAGARVQESPKHDYTLEIRDVPPIVHETDAPPEMGRRYAVRFYYTPYLAADVFWTDEGKRWAREIDHEAEATPALKAAAAQITAGATTDDERARKIYDAVQPLENTSFSRERSEVERLRAGLSRQVQSAEQVWAEKGGSRNEIATLYLALARAAGLQASAMSVADRRTRIFDAGYLSLDQLTVTLVVLHINGNDLFLDPGEKLLPFGQLSWSHTLAGGLLETGNGVIHAAVTPTNNVKDAITAHTADLSVDAQGNISGTVKVLINGPEALRWRQLNLTADPGEVQRQISESLHRMLPQGINAEFASIQGLDTSAGFVTASFRVSGTAGTVTGKRLLLPGFFFSAGPHTEFVSTEKRESAIDVHYANQVIDDVVYHLGAGYSVESAPQPTQLPWPEHAVLVVKTQQGPGTIDVKHIYARAFVVLDPKEYPALHDYYQKLATNDQQQLVLTSAETEAGN
jgi:Domain of Unknown Function with PDB structure (DUF3857)/Transglutaminase-like superfamily